MVKYRSSKLAQKKKKVFQLKIILILVILISFLFSLSTLSKLDFLKIKNIKIKGNNIVKEKDVRDIINENIIGNYFYLFSKNNILIYPRQEIRGEILEKFFRIKEVNLNLDLPNLLNINITERTPYVLWCRSASLSECYLADNEGFIFANSEYLNNKKIFHYYTGLNDSIGQNIFSSGVFKEIDSFVQFIDGLNLEPYKFVEVGENYEMYFGNKNSKIIFTKKQDVKEVMNNLQSVLNMEEFADMENFKNLKYIDLRFGNKVFYK